MRLKLSTIGQDTLPTYRESYIFPYYTKFWASTAGPINCQVVLPSSEPTRCSIPRVGNLLTEELGDQSRLNRRLAELGRSQPTDTSTSIGSIMPPVE